MLEHSYKACNTIVCEFAKKRWCQFKFSRAKFQILSTQNFDKQFSLPIPISLYYFISIMMIKMFPMEFPGKMMQ